MLALTAVAVASPVNRLLTGTAQAQPLWLGFFPTRDTLQFGSPANQQALVSHMSQAGGSMARVIASWNLIGPYKPPNAATAQNPNWSGYDWASTDALIKRLTAAGITPLVTVMEPPRWVAGPGRPACYTGKVGGCGSPGAWRPNTAAFHDFSVAVAKRYSGNTNGLPHVRYYQGWNEPNLPFFLAPQWERRGGRWVPHSPALYRSLLNGFYSAIKGVDGSNFVVTAGTAPFGDSRAGTQVRFQPAAFWRDLLCVRGRDRSRAVGCPKVHFDALAHHPYTGVDATRASGNPDDVSVADLGHDIIRPLRLATQRGTVLPRATKPVWITEIGFPTGRHDHNGVSLAGQSLAIRQAFYLLWKQGVRVIDWYTPRDCTGSNCTRHSGLYFRDARNRVAYDRRKPGFYAYRFPFVAWPIGRDRVNVWGLAPYHNNTVLIQVRYGSHWATIMRLKAGAGRVFYRHNAYVRRGRLVRARAGGLISPAWRVR